MAKYTADLIQGEPLKARMGVAKLVSEFPDETETVFDLIEKLEDGSESVNKSVSVFHRTLQPAQKLELKKARSPRRSHVFHDIESFKDYVAKHQVKGSAVLANALDCEATFVIDELAEGGFETVTYKPTFHPILAKWMESPWTAIGFSQFILENRRCVVDGGVDENDKPLVSARDIIMAFRQIRTSKNVTVESGQGAKTVNGVMIEVVVGSSAGKKSHEVVVELPDLVRIKTPIFVNSSEVSELDFDLFVFNDCNDRVMVSATNADLDAQIAAEFVSQIQDLQTSLDGMALVGFAKYETSSWPTV